MSWSKNRKVKTILWHLWDVGVETSSEIRLKLDLGQKFLVRNEDLA